MSQPVHTPGPVIARPEMESRARRITITGATSPVAIAEIVPTTHGYDALAEANGRFIRGAYNAFDSAAKKLGCNAVELAERMQEGGLAELVAVLEDMFLFGEDSDASCQTLQSRYGKDLTQMTRNMRDRARAI